MVKDKKRIPIPETGEEYEPRDDGTLTDKHGTQWFRDGYIKADGTGDTFGPGHPNPPAIVKTLRKEPK